MLHVWNLIARVGVKKGDAREKLYYLALRYTNSVLDSKWYCIGSGGTPREDGYIVMCCERIGSLKPFLRCPSGSALPSTPDGGHAAPRALAGHPARCGPGPP